MKIEVVEKLNEKLTTFPGISKKQADKMSNFLLQKDDEYVDDLIKHLLALKNQLSFCPNCNFIKENGKCLSCDADNKENVLMIVESVAIVKKISEMNFFNGKYYVLPYLLSIKNQLNDEQLEYKHLFNFLFNNSFNEVIIVLSPTLDGEITTNHLMEKMKELKIPHSRAAIGMPMNSNVDYLDSFTIKQSINNRNNN
ncbi:toprim domain-containing protein [Mycoplasmopsis iners]|uniref:toprim domain-containing protein n=1 Tax=Mycoplasmopsis iners TaxID=76630 RepID=UPI0004977003|nr:toprim domain-containing protein [Mycoplasmopsis iners]